MIFVTSSYALYATSVYLPEVFVVRTLYFHKTSARMSSSIPFFIARCAGDGPFLIAEMFTMAQLITLLPT